MRFRLMMVTEYSSGEHLRHALMSKEAKVELMARILGQHSRNTNAVRGGSLDRRDCLAQPLTVSCFHCCCLDPASEL